MMFVVFEESVKIKLLFVKVFLPVCFVHQTIFKWSNGPKETNAHKQFGQRAEKRWEIQSKKAFACTSKTLYLILYSGLSQFRADYMCALSLWGQKKRFFLVFACCCTLCAHNYMHKTHKQHSSYLSHLHLSAVLYGNNNNRYSILGKVCLLLIDHSQKAKSRKKVENNNNK